MAIEQKPVAGDKLEFSISPEFARRGLPAEISDTVDPGGAEPKKSEEEVPRINISVIYDQAINYAFQQNAIPIVKELRVVNATTTRYNSIAIKIIADPKFAIPLEMFVQKFDAGAEFKRAPLDWKLNPSYLGELKEKVTGLLRVEVWQTDEEQRSIALLESKAFPISLLAHNEWCGLVSLPEILGAFVLPNDPAVMPILGRAADLLEEHTGRSALNGYQDKNRERAWQQAAAIYKAVSELEIRYINPPASFEKTGQKVRFPSEVVAQKFGTCLDLVLLMASCLEQAGLFPLIFMHEGHAYAGCWLEEGGFAEPWMDDLQQARKLSSSGALSVFESTLLTDGPSTLENAEQAAEAHLMPEVPFKMALDIHAARIAKIHPLPIPGQPAAAMVEPAEKKSRKKVSIGIGKREFVQRTETEEKSAERKADRIDQWKSKLLDLTLRNRLLNFRETKSTIGILTAEPERVEDNLAAEVQLQILPKPKVMSETDPRNAKVYSAQQKAHLLAEHLKSELKHKRLHTTLSDEEHNKRLTELYRASRVALEENGTNTLYVAVGMLEWQETEHSDRKMTAPLLLVPVQLKRKSILEGFSLIRYDEETRLNVTLMEMLKQHFHKDIPGVDPLPTDESGVDVAKVLQIFKEAVRDLKGWEVKPEIWLAQFSFTKFLLWKDLSDRLESLTTNKVVSHLVNQFGNPFPNPLEAIEPEALDTHFHPKQIFCPRSADSSQLAAVMMASEGHDFVLEGPPGTGKSQTITNIIAHCLANGKRVLFVAEKRAALDVVHRRLKEEGLEPFCLELHSNKTGKAEVVAQFDKSLKFAASETIVDWDSQTELLNKTRNGLNEYVRALHAKRSCGLSAYQCLDYLLPRIQEPTVSFEDNLMPMEVSRERLHHLREVAKQINERSKLFIPLADHPLTNIHYTEWTPAWADKALRESQKLKNLAESVCPVIHETRAKLGFLSSQASLKEFNSLLDLTGSLLKPEPVGSSFVTTQWQKLIFILNDLIRKVEDRVQARSAFEADVSSLWVNKAAEGKVQCELWTNHETGRFLQAIEELLPKISSAINANKEVAAFLHLSTTAATREALIQRILLVDCLIAPCPVPGGFLQSKWEELGGSLNALIQYIGERAELRKLLNDYDEAKLLQLDLDAVHNLWTSAQNTWILPKLLKTSKVQRLLQSAQKDGRLAVKDTFTAVIQNARRLKAIHQELSKWSSYAQETLGPRV